MPRPGWLGKHRLKVFAGQDQAFRRGKPFQHQAVLRDAQHSSEKVTGCWPFFLFWPLAQLIENRRKLLYQYKELGPQLQVALCFFRCLSFVRTASRKLFTSFSIKNNHRCSTFDSRKTFCYFCSHLGRKWVWPNYHPLSSRKYWLFKRFSLLDPFAFMYY